MRHIRTLFAFLALLLPMAGAGVALAQPASATQGFVFVGACTVNAQATFSPGLVKASGLGTCVVDTNIVTMDFSTTAFPVGPSSCAATVATGGGSFDLGAPIGVADSPTTEQ